MNEIVRANQSSSDQINISYNTNFTRSYITLHTIERKQYSALQHSPVLLSWQQASSLSWQRQVLWSTSVGGWWQRQRLQRRRCVSNSNRTHLQQLLTIWHRAAAAAAYTDGGSGRWRLTGSNWLHARLADWASENVIQAVGRSPTRPGLHNAHCTTTTTTTTIHHHPPLASLPSLTLQFFFLPVPLFVRPWVRLSFLPRRRSLIDAAAQSLCRCSITGSPRPRKVSSGRQFTGKNRPRPPAARAGRIFNGKLSAGGDFYGGNDPIMGRLVMWSAIF